MRVYILFDSYFGNTEKVANIIASQLEISFNVQVKHIDHVDEEYLKKSEVLVVGSPTRGFSPSKKIKLFFRTNDKATFKGKYVAAFDTRVDPEDVNSKMYKTLAAGLGYAAESIEKKLQARGAEVLIPAKGFYVVGNEGPFRKGQEEQIISWSKALVHKLSGIQ